LVWRPKSRGEFNSTAIGRDAHPGVLSHPLLRVVVGTPAGETFWSAILVANPSLGVTLILQASGSCLVVAEIFAGPERMNMVSAYSKFAEPTEVHVERLDSVVKALGEVRLLAGVDVNARSML